VAPNQLYLLCPKAYYNCIPTSIAIMSLVPRSIYSTANVSQSSLSQVDSSIQTGGGSLTGTHTPTASISTGPPPSTGSAVALFDSGMAKAEKVLEEILEEVAHSKGKGSFVERFHAVAADRLLAHRENHSDATELERDLQKNATSLLKPIPELGQATDAKNIDKIREYGKIFLQFKPMAGFIWVRLYPFFGGLSIYLKPHLRKTWSCRG
jgi:hypothetical protein